MTSPHSQLGARRSFLFAPLPKAWWARGVNVALFFVGVFAALGVIPQLGGLSSRALIVGTLSAIYVLSHTRWPARCWRSAALTARVLIALLYLGCAAAAGLVGSILSWATPWWVDALAAAGGLAAFVTGARAHGKRSGFWFSAMLPLGLWLIACAVGWGREDGLVRCDDYLSVSRDVRVEIVEPTTGAMSTCAPGEVLRVGHYPRRVWEAPDGERLVFTTQMGIDAFSGVGREVGDRFPGVVCEAWTDGRSEPRCLWDSGKAQVIMESEELDLLFIGAYEQGWSGDYGALLAVSRSAPLRVVEELSLPQSVGEGFYAPGADLIGLFTDEGREMNFVRASDLTLVETRPLTFVPGESRYDPGLNEGIACFAGGPLTGSEGSAFLSVAFRDAFSSHRPLGSAASYPWAWVSLVWGCDWDPERREAYIAVANLGLLVTVDYDSGRVLRSSFIGFGTRSVQLDRARGRLYVAQFLQGSVLEIDLATGDRVGSWFIGRFARSVSLSRDGRGLFVTSNLGIIRIPLDEPSESHDVGSDPDPSPAPMTDALL